MLYVTLIVGILCLTFLAWYVIGCRVELEKLQRTEALASRIADLRASAGLDAGE